MRIKTGRSRSSGLSGTHNRSTYSKVQNAEGSLGRPCATAVVRTEMRFSKPGCTAHNHPVQAHATTLAATRLVTPAGRSSPSCNWPQEPQAPNASCYVRRQTLIRASSSGAGPGGKSQGHRAAKPRAGTSISQLLQHVQQRASQGAAMEHAYVGWVSIQVCRLLAQHQRALVVIRRDHRRALWVLPNSGDTPTAAARLAYPTQSINQPPVDPRPQSLQVLQLLLTHSASLEHCTDPVAAAHLVQALGTARYTPVPYTEVQAVLHAMQPLLSTMQQDCLSKLVWGLGAMHFPVSDTWLQAAISVCQSRSGTLGTQSTVRLLEGLAGLQVAVPRDLLDDLTRGLRPHLAWLTPRQQVTVLHSLAGLGYAPSEQWLLDWCQHSSAKLSGLTMPLAAQAATSFQRLKYAPPQWWVAKFLRYSEQAMTGEHTDVPHILAAGSALLRLNQELPSSWLHHGLACVRGQPPPLPRTRPRIPYVRGVQWTQEQRAQARALARQVAASAALAVTAQTAAEDGAFVTSQPGSIHSSDPAADSHSEGGGAPGTQPKAAQSTAASDLSPAQCVQAVYIVVKQRENLTAARHVTWARAVLERLLDDVPAITAGGWSQPAHGQVNSRQCSTPARTVSKPPAPPPSAPPPPSVTSPQQADAQARGAPLSAQHRTRRRARTHPLVVPPIGLVASSSAEIQGVPQAGVSGSQELSNPPELHPGAAHSAASLPRIALHADHDSTSQLQATPDSRAQPPLSATGVQDLVDVLYACAELRLTLRQRQRDRLLKAMKTNLHLMSPAQRTTIMVCLAVLKITPSPGWSHVFFSQFQASLALYSAQELANTLTATAYLGMDPGGVVLGEVLRVTQQYPIVQQAMLVRKLQGARVTSQVAWLAQVLAAATQQLSNRAR